MVEEVNDAKISWRSERSAGSACIGIDIHDERGLIILLGDATCDDTDDAFMIVFAVCYKDILCWVYL